MRHGVVFLLIMTSLCGCSTPKQGIVGKWSSVKFVGYDDWASHCTISFGRNGNATMWITDKNGTVSVDDAGLWKEQENGWTITLAGPSNPARLYFKGERLVFEDSGTTLKPDHRFIYFRKEKE